MISYAQNFEDVMIARLFPSDHRGFYIDIGAADPVRFSVTKHFYDAGWQGVNVEPLPHFFARLTAARARDVNLQAMVGVGQGLQPFYEIAEFRENSTGDQNVMESLRQQGATVHTHEVGCTSLAEICERHAGDRGIDFLKIDVEGSERDVLDGADWRRFRPVLVVVEAVAVNRRDETWAVWEPALTGHEYEKVWFDGLNNFYLRRESLELKRHFQLPPNVFDKFTKAELRASDDGWIDLSETVQVIDADRIAKQAVIDHLIRDLDAANADRAAKQEIVDRLVADLTAANADREAKQAVMDRLVADLTSANADRMAKQNLLDRMTERITALVGRSQ
ncbi:FkbM family methyltransferase [Bradyrhizobium jicamae]|uniref:FkbM family methyltransferase n=1 Tax=Bradyrhizobium jicamae TaxID=280332 RepID=UPI001BA7C60D|nr:FkbM family methyltransferase [Bradyrhizobium jicamae]MBR0754588.1 FkbM family methyltransferase [Bradyrhizobium jicamae]